FMVPISTRWLPLQSREFSPLYSGAEQILSVFRKRPGTFQTPGCSPSGSPQFRNRNWLLIGTTQSQVGRSMNAIQGSAQAAGSQQSPSSPEQPGGGIPYGSYGGRAGGSDGAPGYRAAGYGGPGGYGGAGGNGGGGWSGGNWNGGSNYPGGPTPPSR